MYINEESENSPHSVSWGNFWTGKGTHSKLKKSGFFSHCNPPYTYYILVQCSLIKMPIEENDITIAKNLAIIESFATES